MKKTIFSMALCLTLVLSGCAQSGNGASESTSTALPDKANSFSHSGDETPLSISQIGESAVIPIAVKQADWSSIQGKTKGIYPAGGSQVLVLADQISLYDLASGKVVATAQAPAWRATRVWTLDSGYAIAGQVVLERSSGGLVENDYALQFRVAIYDGQLSMKTEVDISGLLAEEEFLIDTDAIAVSADGNRIAFATQQSVTLYDCTDKKRTKLIDLTGEDGKARLGITTIEQMGFTNNGKSIAFKGQSFDIPAVIGKPSFDTVGTIHIDGSGLTNKKPEGYAPKMLTSYPSRLLVAEDFMTASGRMMVIDSNSGEQKIHTLADKKEGENIYGSDTGRYFASSIASKTGWTIRVYETDTGTLVKEESISNDGQELYGINDPMMCVLDDAKTCMVLLGHKQKAVDTKIASFSF